MRHNLEYDLGTIDIEQLDIEDTFEKLGYNHHNKFNPNPPKTYTYDEKKIKIQKQLDTEQSDNNEYLEYMKTDEYINASNIIEIDNLTIDELNDKFDWCGIMWNSRLTKHTIESKKTHIVKKHIRDKNEADFNKNYMPTHKFTPNTEYISFTIENGSFACRNILVPKTEFEIAYPNVLNMLRENSTDRKTYTNGVIENTLTSHYKPWRFKDEDSKKPTAWSMISTPVSRFSGGMMVYADCDGYGSLIDNEPDSICDKNKPWYTKSVCESYGYFNPETGNFQINKSAAENNCTVSESFIFLEEHEGQPKREYEYETPDELLVDIISNKLGS
jgi:hypothetical protein